MTDPQNNQTTGCCGPLATAPRPPASGSERSTHAQVREAYAKAADTPTDGSEALAQQAARAVGYSATDVSEAGSNANLGLACGNPQAIAQIQPGEVVLDLGSGAGFDALIAAPKLGDSGRFIGVDMTPAMLERARTNVANAGFARIAEFREGLIEQLPVVSGSVDLVISNCVINLSPDKAQVFREIYRVLKPGGRIAISDIALDRELPPQLKTSGAAWNACVGGAITWSEYREMIQHAGLAEISHTRVSAASLLGSCGNDPISQQLIATVEPAILEQAMRSVYSYSIQARKP